MKIIVRILIVLAGLAVFVALLCVEESWRGKRDWEKYKQKLEAKGEVLDWNKFIPPPVPDDQNFFKVPKMAEWFVMIGGQFKNELTARLNYPDTTAVTIGELTVLSSTTNSAASSKDADLVLRYSSFGTAVFLADNSLGSTNIIVIPLIIFEDVPLTTAIENLARQAGVRYSLDPKIGYNQPDENGEIKPEPVMSVRWKNITARQALLAVLNKYDLQLMDESNAGVARITTKASGAPKIYASSAAREKTVQFFRNAIGANAIGSQGFAFLVKPVSQIKPVHIVLHSEKTPDEKEIIQFFMEFFPNDAAKSGLSHIRVESDGVDSFRIVLDSAFAGGYLERCDQYGPDFDLIREALKRPYAQIEGDYTQPFQFPTPNYVVIRNVAQVLDQQAKCHLLLDQPDKALSEVTLIHDMCRLLEEPTGKPITLVTAMINVAVTGLYVDTVKNGIRLNAWREPQLAVLQKQLKEINLLPIVANAIRAERAGACYLIETDLGSKIHKRSGFWVGRYQNLTTLAMWDQELIDGIDLTNNLISPDKFKKLQMKVDEKTKHFSPYALLAAIAVPNFIPTIQTLARNQTHVNEAQIACALERYHLVHGEYAETLDALVPQFAERIPHDIIGGGPLHYRRTTDGKFLLYSVGWNETDDGGITICASDGKEDRKAGDWVWQHPLQ